MSKNRPYNIQTGLTEIIKIIEYSSKLDGNIIWQIQGDIRNVYGINSIDYDLEKKHFCLILDKPSKLNIKHESTYIKLTFRNSIFKVDIIEINDRVVILNFPEEVMATEGRKAKRRVFTSKDKKYVTFGIKDNGIKQTIKLNVLDISTTGMALNVTELEYQMIFDSDYLQLEKLASVSLFKPIESILIYVHEVDDSFKRIGIIFRNQLSQDLIEEFSK